MSQIGQFGYWQPAGDVHKVLESALLVEKKGFNIIRFGDHTLTLLGPQVEYSGAMATVVAIGMKTKKIMVAIGVTDPYRRHPVALAQDIATLDKLTAGRSTLGLGAGEEMNLAPFGIEWNKPLTHLSEATIVIRKLWTADPEHPAYFKGRVFSLERAYLQIKPVQKPHPRIYIGALGPKTRELAGQLADGWYPAPAETPKTFKDHLRDVKRGVEEAGRKIEDIDAVAAIRTAISNDTEEAYKAVEWGTKLSFVTCGMQTLKKLGYNVELPEELAIQRILPTPRILTQLNEAIAAIPRKFVEASAAFGTVDDCIKKIGEYIRAGATSVEIVNHGPDINKTMDLYGRRIIPYFKIALCESQRRR